MKYSKIKIHSDLLDFMDGHTEGKKLVKSRKEMFELFLTLIAEGYYDEVFEEDISKERKINIPSDLSSKASQHIKEFGYRRLSDALEVVLSHENELENNYFGEIENGIETESDIDMEKVKNRPLNYDGMFYQLLKEQQDNK